jgi:hypothetical protein
MFLRISGRGAPLLFPVLAFCFVPACGSGFSDAGDGGSSKDGSVTTDGGEPSESGSEASPPPPDATPGDATTGDGPVLRESGMKEFRCGPVKACKTDVEYCEEFVSGSGTSKTVYTCPSEECTADPEDPTCSCALALSMTAHPFATCSVIKDNPGECTIKCTGGMTAKDASLGGADAL